MRPILRWHGSRYILQKWTELLRPDGIGGRTMDQRSYRGHKPEVSPSWRPVWLESKSGNFAITWTGFSSGESIPAIA